MRPPFGGGDPLEFGDEIWRQKTRIMGLPDGAEIMTLAFFVLTQYRRVTDVQTDRHVAIPITRASVAQVTKQCPFNSVQVKIREVVVCLRLSVSLSHVKVRCNRK